MPQPLSRVKTIKFSVWGTIAFRNRPDLAISITEIIGQWAETELRFAGLLAVLLKSEMPTGMAMYLSLSGAEARRAVLDGAAEKVLSQEERALYFKTMKAIKPVRDRRNEFAHGVWGFCDELPDALLWAKPEHRIARDIAMHEARLAKDHEALKNLATSQMPEIMVYRRSDLSTDFQRALHANMCVWSLTKVISKDSDIDEALQRLLASPLLQALDANQRR
jgi:hypothetical protein